MNIITKRTQVVIRRSKDGFFVKKRVNGVLLQNHGVPCAEAYSLYQEIDQQAPYAEDYVGDVGDFGPYRGDWRLIAWLKEEIRPSERDRELMVCVLHETYEPVDIC